jgi:putative endonuclease
MFFVYVLQSQLDTGLYIGYTSDLRRRVRQHISGEVKSTRCRRPLKLIYYEAYLMETDARGRELFLKSGSGRQFIAKQLHHYFEQNRYRKAT